MKLSVVTTLYYSEKYIDEFYNRVIKEILKITNDYEFVFVNDGSPDNSLKKVLELRQKDNNVKVIDLSRNFGQHKAVMTGLMKSTGDYVFLLDIDLEEKPELLSLFWDEFNNNKDIDVVYGVQKERKGGIFEKLSGSLFFTLFNLFTETKIPRNSLWARLMTRRYLDSILEFKENEIVFGGVSELAGFKKLEVPVEKGSKGVTTYNLFRKINLTLNFLTGFTYKPLLLIFYFGFFISTSAFIFVVYLIFRRLFFGYLEGWTSVIASIWLLGGIIILCLGFIGLYLSKIFIEVKNRPRTIIRKIYE
jgi:putative glycosyltransferase